MQFNFEWDQTKAKINIQKHHFSFDEASEIFLDPLQINMLDDEQYDKDERWVTIGQTKRQKLLLVVHTYIEYNESMVSIRMISAREATIHERRQYEE